MARRYERTLREEQEEQYREAEERDRRAAEAHEAQEAARRAEERRRLEEEAAAEEARELAAAVELSKSLHRESDVASAARRLESHAEPAKGAAGVASLRFQLPSGHKLERRFDGSDTVQTVRDFIMVAAAELNTPLHTFNLCTTFPRRVFTDAASDTGQDLRSAGLFPHAMLLVVAVDAREGVDTPS